MSLVTSRVLEQDYNQMKESAARLRQRCQSSIARYAAGPADSDDLLALYRQLGQARTMFVAVAALDGVTAYAQTVENDVLYDVVAELEAINTVITVCLAWVDDNYPADGGYIKTMSIDDGVITFRTFPVGATAPLRTNLQAIVDLISA